MKTQYHQLSRRHFLSMAGAAAFVGGLSAPFFGISGAHAAPAPGASPAQKALWSPSAWKAAEPFYAKILRHPFILGLADGTLPHEKFLYYAEQDIFYLESYAKTLAALAARMDSADHREALSGFIKDTIAVERYSREDFIKGATNGKKPEISPTCQMYAAFEAQQAAQAPVAVGMAAVLPCFWVYQKVGAHLIATKTGKNNPYEAWINAYNDEAYNKSVAAAIRICDELAATGTADVRQRMTEVFVAGVKMEWMFWDSAWKMERWPL